MSFYLTWGIDRGLGISVPVSPYTPGGSTGVVGTAPPAAATIYTDVNNATVTLQEDVGSPVIERGVQCTAQHTFKCTYSQGVSILGQLGMGTIVVDSAGLFWRVLTATVQADSESKGNSAKLITVSECLSLDTPPDEFQVNSVDLGIDIIKHPRYFPNLYPTDAELMNLTGQIKETIIRAIQTYRDSPFFPTAATLYGLINGQVNNIIAAGLGNGTFVITIPNPNFRPQFSFQADLSIRDGSVAIVPTAAATSDGQTNDTTIPVAVNAATVSTFYDKDSISLAIAAAQEIITKLWRMEDSPYMPGVEVKYSQYTFLPPYLEMGSKLQDPTFIIPAYFIQPDRPLSELPPRGGGPPSPPPPIGDNIFVPNALLNPQDYSADGTVTGTTQISWLRKCDEIQYERTWFKRTQTWVGSAIGYFDKQIYSANERPKTPSDYQTFATS